MSAEFPRRACARAELCFYGNDCRRLSAAVWPRRPLRLWEAVAAPYWSYLFGWTMTSVRRWRCRLRQHLGELGCNRGRGSPIKSSLVDLTLNQYKKKNHNLDTSLCDPKKTESQKCFACCDSFLGGIYKCNLYCAVKSRKLKSLSRLWSFGGNFILPWQHAYEDF